MTKLDEQHDNSFDGATPYPNRVLRCSSGVGRGGGLRRVGGLFLRLQFKMKIFTHVLYLNENMAQ